MPTPEFITTLRSHIGHDPLWLSTTAGVVLDNDARVLLGRRSDTGTWALPGGIIDPAEQPADAAVREIYEKTGVLAVPERLVAVSGRAKAAFAFSGVDHLLQGYDALCHSAAVAARDGRPEVTCSPP